ncbi:MAG: ABC transporter permease [Chloroflexi bacterium]|nr:ABC transporter permease [Chloroflexota bacterium]
MKIALSSPSLNPVLVKELRGRMRGPRAYLFLTGVLVLLGLVSFGLFQLVTPRYGTFNQPNVAAGAMIGQFVFVGLVFLTIVMVCVIAPSLTATAISGEHQRKTFDLLMATPLAPFTILTGKLGAALSYVALILLAALPMMSLAYVFGGVTLSDLVRAFLVMGGFALTYAVIGLFFSALFRRTGIAVGASFVLVAFCLFGTLFVYLVLSVMRGEQPPNWVLALNPFSVLSSALVDGVVTDPNNVFGSSSVTPLLWGLAGGRFDNSQTQQLALWYYALGIYGWLTVFLFALTTQLIKPVQRFRFRPLTWVLLVLLFVGPIVAALFLYTAFGFGGVRAAWRWATTSQQNIVLNSKFTDAWEQNWRVDQVIQKASAPSGSPLAQPISTTDKDGKHALHVWNSDADTAQAFAISQPLQFGLPDGGTVRVRVTMRLGQHRAPACGKQGDTCPLMVKLQYTDASGARREWSQGFYASGEAKAKLGLPPRCQTCPSCKTCPGSKPHIRVTEAKWYTFESQDLFQNNSQQTMPKSLDQLVLKVAGTQYEAQIAEASVIVHEGRPLFEDNKKNRRIDWSLSSLTPWWIWSFINGGRDDIKGGRMWIRQGGIREVVPLLVEPLPPIPQPTAALPPPSAQ